VRTCILFAAVVLCLTNTLSASDQIRLANNPSLSPDGAQLAFDWAGDIWVVPTSGGTARALTQHPGKDTQPKFSPDGREIAFISDRDGTAQVYVMPVEGGTPTRLTYHTAGYGLEGWTPDGTKLIVRAGRDHYWRHLERFFLIGREGRTAEELLFDDYGAQSSLSPDGKKLLFTRESTQWWRKGYHGSQASQVWQYDLDSKTFTKICSPDRGATWPVWKADGSGCYVANAKNGSFNIHEIDFGSSNDKQLTSFADDSVVQMCISKDGRTIAFRHLFDLYSYRPGSGGPPTKIDIRASGDRVQDPIERRTLTTAQQVSFASDGLEIAFISGGDLWVMDTELKEPKRVTKSAEEERDPAMSPDGQFIVFVSDMHGECNIWRAERGDKNKWWWQNSDFKLQRLTQDKAVKSHPKLSPDGKKLAYLRDRGDLHVMDVDGKNDVRMVKSFSAVEFDWSPDSKWLVYSAEDDDFNRDVWVMPLDGSKQPFNLSRTPFPEHFPVWSPDGKCIAWVGRRGLEEVDIHYVWLRAEDDEATSRDRTIEKALDKMKKARPNPTGEPSTSTVPPASSGTGRTPPVAPAAVTIDFDKIHDRIHFVSIPESQESDLFWSPDGKKLAFTGTVEGKRATYSIELPDDPKPKQLNAGVGSQAHWLKNGQITWLANGIPASFAAAGGAPTTARTTPTPAPAGGGRRPGGAPAAQPAAATSSAEPTSATEYRFSALQDFDRGQKYAAAFDLSWRTMRDNFYDERLGNRNWDAVRMKYIDMAKEAPDTDTLATVVNLMLGELNGSHLGFTAGSAAAFAARNAPPADPAVGPKWSETTAHLGVRFDPAFAGPGLKVRDVLPGSPADQNRSRLQPGEVILTIDGQPVQMNMDLTKVLNGPPNRELTLKVVDGEGKERTTIVRPISYTQARTLLYKQWTDGNRAAVDKLSNGTLGYLHIDAMAMPSFWRFESELYAVGNGKDGLVIDVRENGGGSTADHLLTALCQPEHAITVPRGGGPGYPQDRKVYACWNKPIVVLCNQNSFSNAEIFSHAIKTLKRGQLVGVPTAGGVLSTGAAPIMDVGTIRLPFRGWFLPGDGRDMELNGAVPHHIVWPNPGDMPAGKDLQLEKAVNVLSNDVVAWKSRPQPKLKKASELEPSGAADRQAVSGGE
jgi:tricorn protease